jgi:hypothetical protein
VELRQNTGIAATRPIGWLAAVFVVISRGLIGWYALQSSTPIRSSSAGNPPITSGDLPRDGGPGGQVEDPDQRPRDGGPGGQIGDIP